MKTCPQSTEQASHWQIRHAVYILKKGGVLAYPTEAVFGLGCLPDNLTAIKRLLEIKQRPAKKGLILIASDIEQLMPYLAEISPQILDKISASWPGPNTWILPAAQDTSPLIRGDFKSVAVRVSNHPIVRELCQQSQSAIISTSANISGKKMTYDAFNVRLQFKNQLDYILNGSLGTRDKPSIIKDALTDKIIRH
ncbi:MAG: threonylcarbamoyl-AMP synthase [Gammaproteobacteria bacterium]|nr:threonylcarbamoyl-AMP synthase [Gammaproteobacteria bacterium]